MCEIPQSHDNQNPFEKSTIKNIYAKDGTQIEDNVEQQQEDKDIISIQKQEQEQPSNNNYLQMNPSYYLNESSFLNEDIEDDIKNMLSQMPNTKQIAFFIDQITENNYFTDEMTIYAFILIERFFKVLEKKQKQTPKKSFQQHSILEEKNNKIVLDVKLKTKQKSIQKYILQFEEFVLNPMTFRPLIIVSMFITQKFYNDKFLPTSYFSSIYPMFTKKNISEMEQCFLEIIDFQICTPLDQIYQFYNKLYASQKRSLSDRSSMTNLQTLCTLQFSGAIESIQENITSLLSEDNIQDDSQNNYNEIKSQEEEKNF